MCTSHVAGNTQWLVSMGKQRKRWYMMVINAIARYDKDVDEVTVLGDDETLAKMSAVMMMSNHTYIAETQ